MKENYNPGGAFLEPIFYIIEAKGMERISLHTEIPVDQIYSFHVSNMFTLFWKKYEKIPQFSQIFNFWRHRTFIQVPFHLLDDSKLCMVHNPM